MTDTLHTQYSAFVTIAKIHKYKYRDLVMAAHGQF